MILKDINVRQSETEPVKQLWRGVSRSEIERFLKIYIQIHVVVQHTVQINKQVTPMLTYPRSSWSLGS